MSDSWGDTGDDGWGSSSTTTTPAASTNNNSSSGGGGWGGGGGGSDWGGSGRTSSGGDGGGRGGGRNGSTWGKKPGWGSGLADGPAAKEGRPANLRLQSQVTIEKMSVDTLASDIRSNFGRFGIITRLVLDYRFEEDRVNCWLDFEKPESAEVSHERHLSVRSVTRVLLPDEADSYKADERENAEKQGHHRAGQHIRCIFRWFGR